MDTILSGAVTIPTVLLETSKMSPQAETPGDHGHPSQILMSHHG